MTSNRFIAALIVAIAFVLVPRSASAWSAIAISGGLHPDGSWATGRGDTLQDAINRAVDNCEAVTPGMSWCYVVAWCPPGDSAHPFSGFASNAHLLQQNPIGFLWSNAAAYCHQASATAAQTSAEAACATTGAPSCSGRPVYDACPLGSVLNGNTPSGCMCTAGLNWTSTPNGPRCLRPSVARGRNPNASPPPNNQVPSGPPGGTSGPPGTGAVSDSSTADDGTFQCWPLGCCHYPNRHFSVSACSCPRNAYFETAPGPGLSGQCLCQRGTRWDPDQLECVLDACPSGMIAAADGQGVRCECREGQRWEPTTRTCVLDTCTNGTRWSATSHRCACPRDQQWSQRQNRCVVPNCEGGTVFDGAQERCVCPQSAPVWQSSRHVCEACPGNQVWNGSSCTCPTAMPRWTGSVCAACGADEIWNGSACTRAPPPGPATPAFVATPAGTCDEVWLRQHPSDPSHFDTGYCQSHHAGRLCFAFGSREDAQRVQDAGQGRMEFIISSGIGPGHDAYAVCAP